MKKWCLTLWFAVCISITNIGYSDINNVKQLSSYEKNSLTVSRLPKTAIRAQEQSTFEKRRHIALEAETKFRSAGVKSDKMIIAILANAWHECRWNPKERSGSCVGFFQLHTKYGGRGLSINQLQNLNHNINKLMSLNSYKEWVQWCNKNPNTTAGNMAFRFASHVERCATKHRPPRRVTADKWYKILNKGP